ncbi:MAG: hypothetical protein HN573_03015 [Candidatus Marinimicrobia bacterium]|nr:hypothetical protein [Candidatus Neomarinimicrobiota bacterium]MBT7580988.1 hypothetical protein [Candidatus Neomarinimicrobiota bacterium]
MRSIKVFLISILIASILLFVFLALVNSYSQSTNQINKVFDAQLIEKKDLILPAIYANSLNNKSYDHWPAIISNENIYFQIYNSNQKIILNSYNASSPFFEKLEEGFRTINYSDSRLRVLTSYIETNDVWVIIAESEEIRFKIADNITIAATTPILFVLPIISILIWLIVSIGLKPINELSESLSKKEVSNLSSLSLDNIPVELTNLVNSINLLFIRLKHSFIREKQLTADIAHELRTPIAGIQIHMENLGNELPKKTDSFKNLQLSVYRLKHLAEQNLTLNKLRQSKELYRANLRELDLNEIIRMAANEISSELSEKELSINFSGIEAIVFGNNSDLQSLTINLLTNALKNTPRGGQIEISIYKETNLIYLEIMDSGTGIPDDKKEKVFERMYKYKGTEYSSEIVGSGIGLSIVKRIVELHRATIELLDSSFSSGLKVRIAFPKVEIFKEEL